MQMEDTWNIDYICDFRNLGTGACDVIAINVHRMNFFLAFNIVK